MNLTPFVRIGLRIFGGYMIGQGMANEDAVQFLWTDPEIAGAVAIAISEGWYFMAKRFGWSK